MHAFLRARHLRIDGCKVRRALVQSQPTESVWVLDSGATCCATSQESDCIDVRDCCVNVTSAGNSFQVKRIGTALINTVDARGCPTQLQMKNTLISPTFPYKLLALQLFTARGYQVVMEQDSIRISNPASASTFVGNKDPSTQLFFLKQCVTTLQPAHAMLARSYGDRDGKTDDALLWKLHLRHGHRNLLTLPASTTLRFRSSCPHVCRVSWAKRMCILISRMASKEQRALAKAFILISEVRFLFLLLQEISIC